MITSIAWKNVWRNKVRSLVVIFATILGLIGGTFGGAFMLGMVEQRLKSAIEKEVSHIQVHNPEFMDNNEIQFSIAGGDSLVNSIAAIPGVEAVSGRSSILGMIASANASSGVKILAVDPDREKRVSGIARSICDSCGSWFGSGKKNSIIISQRLADKLKVRLRSKIVLRFQDPDGNLLESAFKVTGIYRTNNSMFDEQMVFLSKADLSAILGIPAPIHEIAILLKVPGQIGEIKTEIKKLRPGLLVQSWDEVSPELGLLVGVTDKMTYIFLGIILLALAFGIINTMLMAVMERTRELGMLMSIGMNKRRVFSMIMLETVWLTVTGGVVGMIVSYLLILFFNRHGINLATASKGMESLGYDAVVYPTIGLKHYIVLSAMIIITGILSSIYPARKALKIQPAEAIKLE